MDTNNPTNGNQNSSETDSSVASLMFLQAMDQLNRQYPPNLVLRSPSHPPLVADPTTAGTPSSTANATSSAFVPIVQQADIRQDITVTTSNNQRIVIPPPSSIRLATHKLTARDCESLAKSFTAKTIQKWTPRFFSEGEVQVNRNITHQLLDRIHSFEAEQERCLPLVDTHVENLLFLTRLDYWTRFFRIFRINDLPPEIISNIFHLVIWSAPSPRQGILWRCCLTWVCRFWRNINVADITLWNAIWFTDFPHFERSFLWLDRSGNASLDVRINDSPQRPLSLEMAKFLTERLFKKLSNIRIMIIVVQDWDPALFILKSLTQVAEQKLPMALQRLEIHRNGSTYTQIGTAFERSFYVKPISLFGGAVFPSFRYLALNGVHIDWAQTGLVNLTALDMRRLPLERVPTLTRFREILTNSSLTLQKLVLDGAGPRWPESMGHVRGMKPIDLPLLKVLLLGDFSLQYGTYLTSQFNFVNLLDLTLMNLMGDDYSPFFDAVTRMSPILKTLTLHTVGLPETDPKSVVPIVKWLASLPQLVFLRIIQVEQTFMDFFLYDTKTEKLALPKTQDLVCPNLAYLEFHSINADLILTWVRKRMELGFPFRKVYVGEASMRDMSQEQRVKLITTLRSIGTAVQILPRMGKPPEEDALVKIV